MLEHLSPRTMALISGGPKLSDGAQESCKEQSWMLECTGSGQNSLYVANPVRLLLRAACPLLPVFQSFDQTHMRMVIEEGLTGDHILQTLIQGQGLLVLLCDIQRDFWIAVVAACCSAACNRLVPIPLRPQLVNTASASTTIRLPPTRVPAATQRLR
jgi:hypothetical protein